MDMSSKCLYYLSWIVLSTEYAFSQTCPDPKFEAIVDHSACLSPSPGVLASGVDGTGMTEIVDHHNFLRGNVTPTATDMLKMAWDDEVAFVAQRWANNCVTQHDPSYQRRIPGRFSVGQNIAYGTGGVSSWTSIINLWYDEVSDFIYGGPQIPGKVIGHYTQVVWAKSEKIGCGYTNCNGTHFYVCNYAPAGNLDVDFPYTNGTTCDACTSTCNNGLCDCTGDSGCLNGGTRNVDTCACTCKQGFYVPDDCALNCSTVVEPSFCNLVPNGFVQPFCPMFGNVPFDCPRLCGFCGGTGVGLGDNCTAVLVTPCDVINAECLDGHCACQVGSTEVNGACELDSTGSGTSNNTSNDTFQCVAGPGTTTGILRVVPGNNTILRICAISANTPLDISTINETDDRCCVNAADLQSGPPPFFNVSIGVGDDGERPCGIVESPANTFKFAFATFSAKSGSTFLPTTKDVTYEFNCTINDTVSETSLEGTLFQPTVYVVTLKNNWSVALDFRDDSTHNVITEVFVGQQVKMCVSYQTLSHIDGLTFDGVLAHSCKISPFPDFRTSQEIIDANGCSTNAYIWQGGPFQFMLFEFLDSMYEYKACTSAATIHRFPDQEFLYVNCSLTPCMNTTTEPCGGSHCQQTNRKKRSTGNSLTAGSMLRIRREQTHTLEVAPDTKQISRQRRCLDTMIGKVIVGVLSTLVALMFPVCVYVFYQYIHREELFRTSSSGKGLASGQSGTDFFMPSVSDSKNVNKRF